MIGLVFKVISSTVRLAYYISKINLICGFYC